MSFLQCSPNYIHPVLYMIHSSNLLVAFLTRKKSSPATHQNLKLELTGVWKLQTTRAGVVQVLDLNTFEAND